MNSENFRKLERRVDAERSLEDAKIGLSMKDIVCLCGSTRFLDTFREVANRETIAGKIVLTVHCVTTSEHESEAADPALKSMLDEVHLRKIDLADEVLILNVGGYIGESTKRELEYAREHGKFITFFEKEGSDE